ncbi:hypothetical protein F5148DRAFT_1150989 [Russula earlei]|uniref:Uncharacterized protein n=1 Tax=Russula earlei TaxID=71964 RepID=A0ACC0U2U9_9AGAM|nr:hypothetical protein F5148DRAFT_1150989 [Russula earlei]
MTWQTSVQANKLGFARGGPNPIPRLDQGSPPKTEQKHLVVHIARSKSIVQDMALPDPPFPPSGRFIECIHESSRALTQAELVTFSIRQGATASGMASWRPQRLISLYLLSSSGYANISDANIERLLLSSAFTETYHRTATSHGLAFPLKFPSPLSELNFISILALLNIASGYRVPLRRETGRGAWDSMRAFVFGLYLSSTTDGEGDLLGARGMQTLSETKIGELLGVSLHTERQHENIQGVTISQVGGPGWELVRLLKTILDETGKVLVDGGFVAEALKEGARVAHQKVDPASAADVVLERLVRAIPGFRDMSIVNNRPIFCFKKALFLINAVNVRFGARDPSPFPVPQTSHLPVFADDMLPSILIHLGIIDLSTAAPALARLFPAPATATSAADAVAVAAAADPALSLAAAPETATRAADAVPVVDGPVLTPAQAYVLRAAAIEACERIVACARDMGAAVERGGGGGGGGAPPWLKDVTPPDLNNWLWAVANDRALPGFVLRNTTFF